jgi:hypothetical protein
MSAQSRLLLRPLRAANAPAYLVLASNSAVHRYLGGGEARLAPSRLPLKLG